MWLFLIEAGFVGFVVSLCGAVWRGFERGGAAKPALKAWLLVAALFFLMWLIALTRYPAPLP